MILRGGGIEGFYTNYSTSRESVVQHDLKRAALSSYDKDTLHSSHSSASSSITHIRYIINFVILLSNRSVSCAKLFFLVDLLLVNDNNSLALDLTSMNQFCEFLDLVQSMESVCLDFDAVFSNDF